MGGRIPEKHPLRTIRRLTDDALDALSGDFGELYSRVGRPGIAPENAVRPAAAGALLDPLGTAADGTAEVQPAAGSWAWTWKIRCGTQRCSRKARTACCGVTCRCVFWRSCGFARSGDAAFRKAFSNERRTHRNLGVADEFPTKKLAGNLSGCEVAALRTRPNSTGFHGANA